MNDARPRYIRNPAVSATEVDTEIFLVEPETQEVFYLDEITAALWRLLEDPRERQEIDETFAAAFPDLPDEQLNTDLSAALDDLCARELVLRTR